MGEGPELELPADPRSAGQVRREVRRCWKRPAMGLGGMVRVLPGDAGTLTILERDL